MKRDIVVQSANTQYYNVYENISHRALCIVVDTKFVLRYIITLQAFHENHLCRNKRNILN